MILTYEDIDIPRTRKNIAIRYYKYYIKDKIYMYKDIHTKS